MSKKYFSFVGSLLASFLVSNFAFADRGLTDVLCFSYGIFAGPLGQGLAIFAIVALGVGIFMGKITWPLVFAVALGIGAIFGAPKVVRFITGNELCGSDQSTNTYRSASTSF